MLTLSLKVNKQSILTVVMVVTVIVLVAMLVPLSQQAIAVSSGNSKVPLCKTREDLINWINTLEWEIDATPIYKETVVVPKGMDDIYNQYMIDQRQNGFRLDKYKGKEVKQYKFNVLNYNEGKTLAYINILMYKDRVIAADIYSPKQNGFMKPLKKASEMTQK